MKKLIFLFFIFLLLSSTVSAGYVRVNARGGIGARAFVNNMSGHNVTVNYSIIMEDYYGNIEWNESNSFELETQRTWETGLCKISPIMPLFHKIYVYVSADDKEVEKSGFSIFVFTFLFRN